VQCNYFINQSQDLAFTIYSLGKTVDYGSNENDFLQGDSLDNYLIGVTGNDQLYGRAGNDILDGGTGNDTLTGESGNDTYIWGIGSENDVIDNRAHLYDLSYYDLTNPGQDVVRFGNDFTIDSFNYLQSNADLIFQNKSTQETLTISGFFNGENYQVSTFIFSDGSQLTGDQLNKTVSILGTDRDDNLSGTDAHNDKMYGGTGNDILDGGTGNDTLTGESGNDTYIWGIGSGNDVIDNRAHLYDLSYYDLTNPGQDVVRFGNDLIIDSFNYLQMNADLIFQNKSTQETLTISGFFNGENYQVSTFIFSDGSRLTGDQLNKTVSILGTDRDDNLSGTDAHNDKMYGGTGNDSLYGYGGSDLLYGEDGDDYLDSGADNDTLFGGIGNDKLYGGTGNDILDGGIGNDTLTGESGNDTYVWGIGSGVEQVMIIYMDMQVMIS